MPTTTARWAPRIALPVLCMFLLAAAGGATSRAAEAAAQGSGLPDTEGWIEARSPHFTVVSNAGDKRARHVAEQFERLRRTLEHFTRGLAVDFTVPTTTIAFENATDFKPYSTTPSGKPITVHGYFVAGPFGHTVALDAASGDEGLRTVYHDYFHAAVGPSLGRLPAWLDEGLAQYFSAFTAGAGASQVEVGHPIEAHVQFLSRHGTRPWGEILDTTTDSPDHDESSREGSFYAQSWWIVHYLQSTDELSRKLRGLLERLGAGRDADSAMQEALGLDRAALGAAVDAYRKAGVRARSWDLGEGLAFEVTARELSRSETLLALGDLLARRGIASPARQHLEAARAAGAPTAAVETALGAAAFNAAEREQALAHYGKAIAAGATAPEPYVASAQVQLVRWLEAPAAGPSLEPTPGPVRAARDLAAKAVELDGESFAALSVLAETYWLGADDDVAPGLRAIEIASAKRPRDLNAMHLRAVLLARAGRVAEANALIDREMAPRDRDAADQTSKEVFTASMSVAIARVEAGHRAEAAALLDDALAAARSPAQAERVRELKQALDSGAEIRFVEKVESEEAGAARATQTTAIKTYNEAMRLVQAERYEEALVPLKQVVAECAVPDLCARAKDELAQIERLLRHNHAVGQYNEAVTLALAGDRKAAVDKLRAIEPTVENPELLAQVHKLLRQLGAPVKK